MASGRRTGYKPWRYAQTCEECGETYKAANPAATCSPKCRQKRYRRTRGQVVSDREDQTQGADDE